MKPVISRRIHGLVTDYPYVVVSALSPYLFGFKNDKKAVALTRGVAGAILSSALTTNAEWGAAKVISYKTHVVADFAMGLFNLGAPWLFGFSKNKRARNTVLGLGVTGVVVGILSGLFGGLDEENLG